MLYDFETHAALSFGVEETILAKAIGHLSLILELPVEQELPYHNSVEDYLDDVSFTIEIIEVAQELKCRLDWDAIKERLVFIDIPDLYGNAILYLE